MFGHRQVMRFDPLLLVAGILLLSTMTTVGCGPSAPAPTATGTTAVTPKPAPTGADLFARGGCEVKISGAQQVSFTSTALPFGFHTDYWRSEAKTRAMLAAQAAADPDVAESDEAWWVDQKISSDPVSTPLLISCLGKEAGVTLVPGLKTVYADVPFRPDAYEIAPGGGPGDVNKGHFAALVYLNAGTTPLKFIVSKPGILTVSQFDHMNVAGSFVFVAIGAGRQQIDVQGRFAFTRATASR